ncbi:MAG TPA: branched-chain amino acid ABC transporter substrate-binding protein [Actinomycetota bacterium]|nr:branched-chain amino acid ABC transporter substrate-binding protein [Actinomycetota bacterium]
MKKAIGLALAVLAMSVVATSAQGSNRITAASAASFNCKSTITLPLVTPVTGGAGFLGAEQGSWAKYAVKTLAKPLGLKVKFVLGDTPVEQGPAPAQALAQKYVADKSVLVVLGPSTSGAVAASSSTYYSAKIAHISPSATRTSLTQGSPKEATPAFFRVVPGDYIQGPSDANYMQNVLHVKRVVLMDFQEPYSVGLSDAVEAVLKKGGVATTRLSAPNTTTDYSAYVTKVPSDADIVFFPTQKPGDAQTFAQQLIEQGKKAKVFGGDGSNDPSAFKQPGSYVSNFAPDITGIPADKALIAGWKKDNPGKAVGSFGPPSYGAAQVALNAIALSCKAGHGTTTRQAVFSSIKKVKIKNWILGGSLRWSTKSNDPLNAKFYIFQIQSNGSYKLVG